METSKVTSRYFAEQLQEGNICYAVLTEPYGLYSHTKYWLAPVVVREIVDLFHITVDTLAPRKEYHVFSQYHNGVKAEEISNFNEDWHKLPKGWTWNTKLFSVVDVCSDGANKSKLETVDWKDWASLKEAYHNHVWCKSSENFAGKLSTKVEKDKGWMLHVEYDDFERRHANDSRSTTFNRIYKDYQTAEKCLRALETADLMSANMSEHDWALYEVNRTLRLLQLRSKISFEDIDKIRQYLLSLDNKKFENIETKIGGMGDNMYLEYRIHGKKRWNPVLLQDLD